MDEKIPNPVHVPHDQREGQFIQQRKEALQQNVSPNTGTNIQHSSSALHSHSRRRDEVQPMETEESSFTTSDSSGASSHAVEIMVDAAFKVTLVIKGKQHSVKIPCTVEDWYAWKFIVMSNLHNSKLADKFSGMNYFYYFGASEPFLESNMEGDSLKTLRSIFQKTLDAYAMENKIEAISASVQSGTDKNKFCTENQKFYERTMLFPGDPTDVLVWVVGEKDIANRIKDKIEKEQGFGGKESSIKTSRPKQNKDGDENRSSAMRTVSKEQEAFITLFSKWPWVQKMFPGVLFYLNENILTVTGCAGNADDVLTNYLQEIDNIGRNYQDDQSLSSLTVQMLRAEAVCRYVTSKLQENNLFCHFVVGNPDREHFVVGNPDRENAFLRIFIHDQSELSQVIDVIQKCFFELPPDHDIYQFLSSSALFENHVHKVSIENEEKIKCFKGLDGYFKIIGTTDIQNTVTECLTKMVSDLTVEKRVILAERAFLFCQKFKWNDVKDLEKECKVRIKLENDNGKYSFLVRGFDGMVENCERALGDMMSKIKTLPFKPKDLSYQLPMSTRKKIEDGYRCLIDDGNLTLNPEFQKRKTWRLKDGNLQISVINEDIDQDRTTNACIVMPTPLGEDVAAKPKDGYTLTPVGRRNNDSVYARMMTLSMPEWSDSAASKINKQAELAFKTIAEIGFQKACFVLTPSLCNWKVGNTLFKKSLHAFCSQEQDLVSECKFYQPDVALYGEMLEIADNFLVRGKAMLTASVKGQQGDEPCIYITSDIDENMKKAWRDLQQYLVKIQQEEEAVPPEQNIDMSARLGQRESVKSRTLVSSQKTEYKPQMSLTINREALIEDLRKALPNACVFKGIDLPEASMTSSENTGGQEQVVQIESDAKVHLALSARERCGLILTLEDEMHSEENCTEMIQDRLKREFLPVKCKVVYPFNGRNQALLKFDGEEEANRCMKMYVDWTLPKKMKYRLSHPSPQAVINVEAVLNKQAVDMLTSKDLKEVENNSGVDAIQKDNSVVLKGSLPEITAAHTFITSIVKKKTAGTTDHNARSTTVPYQPSAEQSSRHPSKNSSSLLPKPALPKEKRLSYEIFQLLKHFHPHLSVLQHAKWAEDRSVAKLTISAEEIDVFETCFQDISTLFMEEVEVAKLTKFLQDEIERKTDKNLLCLYIPPAIKIAGRRESVVNKTASEFRQQKKGSSAFQNVAFKVHDDSSPGTAPTEPDIGDVPYGAHPSSERQMAAPHTHGSYPSALYGAQTEAEEDPDVAFYTNEGIAIHVYKNSLLQCKTDCIVCPVPGDLNLDHGLASVVAGKAGQKYKDEIRKNADKTFPHGAAFAVHAGDLTKFRSIINVLVRRWKPSEPDDCLCALALGLLSIFFRTQELHLKSVAIPAIGTGGSGYPKEICYMLYVGAAVYYSDLSKTETSIEEIHFIDQDQGNIERILSAFRDTEKALNQFESYLDPPVKSYPTALYPLYNTGSVYISKSLRIFAKTQDCLTGKADVLVCSEDVECTGSRTLASSILKNAGRTYLGNRQTFLRSVNVADVKYTSSPRFLKNNYTVIFHAIIPDCPRSVGTHGAMLDSYISTFGQCIRNILSKAHEKKTESLAMPLFGGDVDEIRRRCMMEVCQEVYQFSQKCKNTTIKTIYIMSEYSYVTDLIKKVMIEFVQKCKSADVGASLERDRQRAKKARNQKHAKVPPRFKPRGVLTSKEYTKDLDGYPNAGTLCLHYILPKGEQDQHCPNKGKYYKGGRFTAYLPNNEEGKKVHQMLKVAFSEGYIFTITTDPLTKEDKVVFADIPHKTSEHGVDGYPDARYLSRVKQALKEKGIDKA